MLTLSFRISNQMFLRNKHERFFFLCILDNETEVEAKKYTFNYQIVNKVGVEVVISYSEFGWKEEINLSPEEILDWYRVFQAIKEPAFTIRASIKGGGMNFLIAGQIEYSLKPMSEENSIIVLPVTAESKNLFYISNPIRLHDFTVSVIGP